MQTSDQTALARLLDCAEALSRLQAPAEAQSTLALGVQAALEAYSVLLYRVHFSTRGLGLALLGWGLSDEGGARWEDISMHDQLDLGCDPLLGEALSSPRAFAVARESDRARIAFAIGPLGEAKWLLEVHSMHRPERQLLKAVGVLLQCFENGQRVWEYANLDTLTRLLNRKTFDTNFEQLIALAERAERSTNDRRSESTGATMPCWLGVLDIDHFKRINDNFGHLFGDEVLLLFAERMRSCFRVQDKLFRFGGEEFVVMIRHVREDHVKGIFERFRLSVERYDFPQVGQVTCSVGYTRIDPAYTPAELLGRADAALYYAKEHGRNQVGSFDELVMQGKLKLIPAPDHSSIQADIDELFI
ncbi:GGDEF domain-containing protein [Cognatazoarcus halotolerans]|uniref:GGDEF domain-containing protein n=1 Tax=Cognatazoarcus halotolerans TaxID=2686016 RepID=UPI00135676E9|nr:GGDEF domain-containing protein [Cognatazoarcus halotolerans]MCB1899627.1 GGDEF domain-containing protein [Rhodocyclaceae bacterium]MCP5309282.1 GGDEF domain-containing protein [Zoogloeaceae bacterium]